jgi:four helix bundle protein
MQPDERLDAWGACHELVVQVYRTTAGWPAAELYGLAAQARRATFAAAVHVAIDPPVHGSERRRFRVERALACLDRLRYALLLAHELGYMSMEEWEAIGRLAHRAEELVRGQLALLATLPRLLR